MFPRTETICIKRQQQQSIHTFHVEISRLYGLNAMPFQLFAWKICCRSSRRKSCSSECASLHLVHLRIMHSKFCILKSSKWDEHSLLLFFATRRVSLSILWLNVQYFRITFQALKLYRCHSALVCRSILQFLLLSSAFAPVLYDDVDVQFTKKKCFIFSCLWKNVSRHNREKNKRNVLLKLLFVCLFFPVYHRSFTIYRRLYLLLLRCSCSLFSSAPATLMLFLIFYTPESPNWNLSEAKFEY